MKNIAGEHLDVIQVSFLSVIHCLTQTQTHRGTASFNVHCTIVLEAREELNDLQWIVL